MAENSAIEWTDHTFNPWIGCTKVSDGCKFCYAETLMDKRYGKVKWGPQGKRVRTSDANWRKPLSWNRKAEKEGIRYRVFCASLADVFEEKPDQLEEMYQWRIDLFRLIWETPHLDWLLLTKRPDIALVWFTALQQDDQFRWYFGIDEDEIKMPLKNLWIGTSVENQEQANKRIPELLMIPAAVRFLSVEPLLGPVDLTDIADGLNAVIPCRWEDIYESWRDTSDNWEEEFNEWFNFVGDGAPTGLTNAAIDWVIVGGESGPHARPMHPDWARDIRDQCVAAGVPFLFKQWGEWIQLRDNEACRLGEFKGDRLTVEQKSDHYQARHITLCKVGKHNAGRVLDGRTWDEFPQPTQQENQ